MEFSEDTIDLGNGVTLELVWIPAGSFLMGSPESEQGRENDEGPQHEVTISAGFWMGKHEVTQEQWVAVMGINSAHFLDRKNPVERVSWNDCQEFIRRLSAKVGGKKFRLPTEGEWEYACRAGGTASFCFGDDTKQLGEYAWIDVNSGGRTRPVGQKKPNAWGLYDMHGNVWEWCQDLHAPYAPGKQTDPTGAVSGANRVIRGGCWVSLPHCCRSAQRTFDTPDYASQVVGVRLAR